MHLTLPLACLLLNFAGGAEPTDLAHLDRFVPRAVVMEWGNVAATAAHVCYHYEQWQPWNREFWAELRVHLNGRMKLYDDFKIATAEWHYDETRLEALSRVRARIGERDYRAGVLPVPIPGHWQGLLTDP